MKHVNGVAFWKKSTADCQSTWPHGNLPDAKAKRMILALAAANLATSQKLPLVGSGAERAKAYPYSDHCTA